MKTNRLIEKMIKILIKILVVVIIFSQPVNISRQKITEVEILENFHTHNFTGICGEADVNPNYHTENDLVSAMNLETGHTTAKAAIAAAARLVELVAP